MAAFAEGLSARGHRVVRFEFPYMAWRRATGRKRPPDRAPLLVDTWKAVIAHLGTADLVIGGKSLGGRVAAMVADREGVRGLVCLGYPFHAPGRAADPKRLDHMRTMRTPTLILQGARDTLGSAADVAGYALSPALRIHWLADGDHGFAPRRGAGRSQRQNWDEAIEAAAAFVAALGGGTPACAPASTL